MPEAALCSGNEAISFPLWIGILRLWSSEKGIADYIFSMGVCLH